MDLEALRGLMKKGKLDLSEQGLEELPAGIGELAELEVLVLAKNKLKTLPESLGSLRKLRRLQLQGNQLKKLPDVFGGLAALEELDLRNNKLTALPPSLGRCSALKTLRLASNAWADFPQLIWSLPQLKQLDGLKGFSRNPERALFERLYGELYKAERSPEARRLAFEAFRGADLSAYRDAQLLELLGIQNEAVRENTRAALLARRPLAKNPIGKQSQVVFLGNTLLKKSQVRDQLKEHGIGYSPQLTPETTHVVLGNSPENYETADARPLTYLSEQELSAFLNTLDTPFLLEEGEAQPETHRNVEELLLSPDPENVAVGLELCKSGGVPPALLTGLFYVARGLGDKKLAEAARKLLKLHAPKNIQEAVLDRTKLFSEGSKAQKNTAETLRYYARKYGAPVDWLRIAFLLKRDQGVGLRYVMESTDPGHPARQEALRAMIKDGSLEYFENVAGYRPDYNNSYATYDPEDFPPEVLGFPDLRRIDMRGCRIRALPEGLGALKNLRVLDLRGNFLSALPADFGQLSALEELYLGDNRFPAFPEQLKALTGLKVLEFVGNRGEGLERPAVSTVPPELRAALPGCQITDGLSEYQKHLESYRWNQK